MDSLETAPERLLLSKPEVHCILAFASVVFGLIPSVNNEKKRSACIGRFDFDDFKMISN